jgi:hypothetical protein
MIPARSESRRRGAVWIRAASAERAAFMDCHAIPCIPRKLLKTHGIFSTARVEASMVDAGRLPAQHMTDLDRAVGAALYTVHDEHGRRVRTSLGP